MEGALEAVGRRCPPLFGRAGGYGSHGLSVVLYVCMWFCPAISWRKGRHGPLWISSGGQVSRFGGGMKLP